VIISEYDFLIVDTISEINDPSDSVVLATVFDLSFAMFYLHTIIIIPTNILPY